MSDENKVIVPKNLVDTWLKGHATQEYSITVHPNNRPFTERFIRYLTDSKWKITQKEGKIVITDTDALKLAQLVVTLTRLGYFVED
jgi:hypothetical protein